MMTCRNGHDQTVHGKRMRATPARKSWMRCLACRREWYERYRDERREVAAQRKASAPAMCRNGHKRDEQGKRCKVCDHLYEAMRAAKRMDARRKR